MHKIHLRKPWSILVDGERWIERADIPETEASSSSDETQLHVYHRKFNATQAVLDSEVQLRIDQWHGDLIAIELNDQPVDFFVTSPAELLANLSGQLRSHNEIRIFLARGVESVPRLSGNVYLTLVE
ncbi:MAG: hypothetical protein VYB72_12180 [Planctomycetota bacterium]|nr:hypothetical protein [Planctomycetota bacterium]